MAGSRALIPYESGGNYSHSEDGSLKEGRGVLRDICRFLKRSATTKGEKGHQQGTKSGC